MVRGGAILVLDPALGGDCPVDKATRWVSYQKQIPYLEVRDMPLLQAEETCQKDFLHLR